MTHPAITARVHPAARHLIEPGALLTDLFDELDLWAVRDDLEREHDIEISDAELERCQTVGDLCRLVERVAV